MNFHFSYYSFFVLILFSGMSCVTKTTSSHQPMNDTTTALSLLLNNDFLNRHMPGYGSLKKTSLYGDTIVFKTDSIIKKHLPVSINGFSFKFLTEEQICEQATEHYSDTTSFPAFFQLNRFQKTDSNYDISLQVTCVMPLFDKNGKKLLANNSSNDKCKFGMLCGGGVNVTVYKENSIFKIRKESSWSD